MLETVPINLHQGQPVFTAGKPLDKAKAAMLLFHGRGASAQSILGLARYLNYPELAFLAPQAANNTWWPKLFMDPIQLNEAWLVSALQIAADLVQNIQNAGIPTGRIFFGGFSQGSILAAEYVARHAQRYGGLFILSGGLFGPPGTARDYKGSLEGTLVFIGCSDIDPHIPLERVEESAAVLKRMGGEVTKRIYPGMGHLINEDEIQAVQQMIDLAL